MRVLGGFLILLSLVLFIAYFVGKMKNRAWRNLGVMLLVFGCIALLIPQ